MTQGSTVRAFSALSSVYAFNGSAVGTITHLAGLRICFPDNVGSAVNITNNYALLINNQTTGTGTVTYTNRWGIYQEGASDLNYFAANTLIGTTVNTGDKLVVNGRGSFSDLTQGLKIGAFTGGSGFGAIYPDTVTPSNTNHSFAASSGATILNVATGGVIDLEINTASALYINSSRLVGINTISPNELLSLGFADNASNSIEFRSSTYARLGLITGGNNTSSSNGYIAFSTRNGGSINEVMRLTTGTNVGIGTSTPDNKLTVFGSNNGLTSSQGNINIYTTETAAIDTGGSLGLGGYYFGTTSFIPFGNITGKKENSTSNNAAGYLAFLTRNGTTGTGERIRITSSGVLDFSTNSGITSINDKFAIGVDSTSYAWLQSFGGRPIVLQGVGNNVLIGTTTDAGYKLDVTGGNTILRGGTLFQGAAMIGATAQIQKISGTSTAAASTVAKKIIFCDHTNTITVKVIAYQSTSNVATITTDFCTAYGSSGNGNAVAATVGNVTSISLSYNNSGSPAYTIDCAVTYTGAAPTLYITVTGESTSNMYII